MLSDTTLKIISYFGLSDVDKKGYYYTFNGRNVSLNGKVVYKNKGAAKSMLYKWIHNYARLVVSTYFVNNGHAEHKCNVNPSFYESFVEDDIYEMINILETNNILNFRNESFYRILDKSEKFIINLLIEKNILVLNEL